MASSVRPTSRVFAVFSFGQEQNIAVIQEPLSLSENRRNSRVTARRAATDQNTGASQGVSDVDGSFSFTASSYSESDSLRPEHGVASYGSTTASNAQKKKSTQARRNGGDGDAVLLIDKNDDNVPESDCIILAPAGQNSYTLLVPEAWVDEKRPESALTIRVFEENGMLVVVFAFLNHIDFKIFIFEKRTQIKARRPASVWLA